MQNKKIGILGYGEIGHAMAKFYKKPLIRDIEINTFQENLDILHVCLPYLKNFEEVVSYNIVTYKPKIVIIHSTIGLGSTLNLYKKFGNVVHSPVRGVHPYLYEGIKTFVKYIGADDRKLGMKVARHFRSIGINNLKVLGSSKSSELGKLLDTTYYGLCIAYHDYANKICVEEKVDFEEVMSDFNTTYNDGYKKLKKENVIRPVLFPPKDGKIGGHCIMPNAQILKKIFGDDAILKAILRHE
ncbi:MAG: hypothetical protein WC070_05015 [Candidatus Magasanikbacteria bacterium]